MKEKKNTADKFGRLLTGIFLGANLCTILMLWVCVISTFVSPSWLPRVSLLGLLFPFFLLANVVFVFFWLIFRAKLSLIPVAGLLLVSGFVMDYSPVSMDGDMKDSTLCFINYNVGGVRDDETYEAFCDFLRQTSADVVCLQEVGYRLSNNEAMAFYDSLGYQFVKHRSRVILTRLQLLSDSIIVHYNSDGGHNGTMAYWLGFHDDSVLVLNNHLESSSLSLEDRDGYVRMIKEHEKDQVKENGRILTRKLSVASKCRAAQVDSLCQFLDSLDGSSIVMCGDFNDTPMSYTYQCFSRRLSSAFRERGSGVGFTFNQRGIYVRIDHLFHSSDWECLKCYVDQSIQASDHYPLVTYLHKKQQ